jgi:hypothetical protein
MKMVDDLFKTDGRWDASATGWALLAWLAVVGTFITTACMHPPTSLQDLGIGAGAVLGGGGLGTYMHSRSTP